MKRVIFTMLTVFFLSLISAMNSTNHLECDCNDLIPSFTIQETGDCIVEFNANIAGDPCHEDVTFEWNFDDEMIASGQNTTYTFPEAGSYVVTLTVTSLTDEGPCIQSVEEVVQITCNPSTGCECQDFSTSIDLTNTSGCSVDLAAIYEGEACVDDVTYTWEMGDGTQLIGSEISHTYSESGSYTVALRVIPEIDGQVIEECAKTIELVVDIDCNATGSCNCETLFPSIQVESKSDCEIDLIGLHEGDSCLEDVTYTWDFGDGTGSTGQNVSHEYAAGGDYTLRLDVTASDGMNTCTKTVTQDIEMTCESTGSCTCTLDPSIEIVEIDGCGVMLRGFHGGDPCSENISYIWDFGDGQVISGKETTYYFTSSGNQTVSLTVSYFDGDMLCAEQVTILVEVDCDPCDCSQIDADIQLGNRFGCTIEAEGIINFSCYQNMSFVWFIDGAEVWTGQTATLNFPGTGSYGLVLAIYGLDGDGNHCLKEKVEIIVDINCERSDCDCENLSPDMEITPAGDCSFDFAASQPLKCFNEIAYYWDFGDGNTANGTTVSHEYSQSGTYAVSVVVRGTTGNALCEKRLTQIIEVSCSENTSNNDTRSSNSTAQFEFSYYPNPTNGLLNLKFQSAEETLINVYSITGQLVHEKKIGQSSFAQLNLNHLAKGVYVIKLVQGTSTTVRYVVLE